MERNTALHDHTGLHQTRPRSCLQSFFTVASIFSIEAACSCSHNQSHTESEMFGHRTTVVFCWWIRIRCESFCTQARHDYIDPCLADFAGIPNLLNDGSVSFPSFVRRVTASIVTPALFMLVVARNATPCLAAAGVRRFPGVSPTRSCAKRTSPQSATSPCRALTRSGLRNLLSIMLSTICVRRKLETLKMLIASIATFVCRLWAAQTAR